jgi:lysyl-tRNA synthetase class 2
MTLSDLQDIRLEKARALRDQGTNPWPNRAQRTHTNSEALARFETAQAADDLTDAQKLVEPMKLVGRIASLRHMGKTLFAHIEDGHGRIQLYIRKDAIGDDVYADILKLYDLGDFIQASGSLFRTRTGEISLRVTQITMLSKTINAPPEK